MLPENVLFPSVWMLPVWRPLRSRNRSLFRASALFTGVGRSHGTRLSQWSCVSPPLCRWQEEGVILTFNEIPEIWGFPLTSGLERETLGSLFPCCWLTGWVREIPCPPSQSRSISQGFILIHPSKRKAARGSPLKCQRPLTAAFHHSQPVPSNQVAVQWCPMNPSSAIKKSNTSWEQHGWKIDKFTFAYDSRHSENCINVTLETWLSWALEKAYLSQREGAKTCQGQLGNS